MNNNKIQNLLVHKITERLQKELSVPISVASAEFELFDKIRLTKVSIGDSQGDTLLSVEELRADFAWIPLLRGKLDFDYIRLSGLFFSFKSYCDKSTNVDFLKKLFVSAAKPNIRIRQILLDDCAVSYTRFADDLKRFPGSFDPNHVVVRNLNADLSIRSENDAILGCEVRSLGFMEQSGFELKNLRTELFLGDTLLSMPEFELELPHSKLHISDLYVSYDSIQELARLDERVKFNIALLPSSFSLPDLKAFVGKFDRFRDRLDMEGMVTGNIGNLKCPNLSIQYGKHLVFTGDFEFSGLPNIDETFVFAHIGNFDFNFVAVQDIVAAVNGKPFLFPKELYKLKCSYSGKLTGFFDNMVLYGQLKTNVGTIRTDVLLGVTDHFRQMNMSGKVRANHLRIGQVLPSSAQLGNVSFQIQTNTKIGVDIPLQGDLKADVSSVAYRGYTYENLRFKGGFINKEFTGEILFDDENGKLDAIGFFNFDKKHPKFKFVANVSDFFPYKMNLISSYPELRISVGVNADFDGGTVDNMNGFLEVNDILLRNGGKTLSYNQIRLSSEEQDSYRQVLLQSDVLSGYVNGKFVFGSMKRSVLRMLHEYMPSVVRDKYDFVGKNDFVYKVSVQKINEISDFFDCQWTADGLFDVYGFYNDTKERFAFNLEVPTLRKKTGRTSFSDFNVKFNNHYDKLDLNAKLTVKAPKFTTTFHADMQLDDDSLETLVHWDSDEKTSFEGEFLATTLFSAKEHDLFLNTKILPTQFILKDSVWNMAPAVINTDLKTLAISDFSIYKTNQFISIDGTASTSQTDSILVSLKNIDLAYISGFIPDESVLFGGDASGTAFITNTFTDPIVAANIHVPTFTLNHDYWGALNGRAAWNEQLKAIDIGGEVYLPTDTVAKIGGGYFIGQDSLDLKAVANNIKLEFLNYWLNPITLSTTGYASGNTHIYGKKRKITVTANAKVDDAKLGVDYLKTQYALSDSIIMKPDSILFRSIPVFDKNGSKAVVKGYVAHQYFKDITYKIDVHCDNVLAMNTYERDNPYFYGQVYASGLVTIAGNEQKTDITAVASSRPKTRVFIPMGGTSTAMDNSFITFTSNDTAEIVKTVQLTPGTDASNLKLSLMVDVNPDAEIQLLIDPKSGDMLRATGDGNLKLDYDVKTGDMKLYGNYTLEKGDYLFTFQNALRKEFKINQGSTIHWAGNPYDATVDISAGYQLTASLSDLLDKSTLSNSNRSSVPVKCLLNLTGNLMQPNIQFDITLPNSDDELNRALKSVINTEEMMNRQIIYLLALNKFYAPEYLRTNSQSELLAVASSTLSSQLNSWASQLFENWDFGVNFRSSGEGESQSNEYEFAFLYSPNSKLVINGNVGYRDDNLSASKFIGDVDVEYKLTPNGKLRAKAYNHTNDYKEFKTALTTQGVGLVYRESFSSLKDLSDSWKQTIQRRKEERAEKKETRRQKKARRAEQSELKK